MGVLEVMAKGNKKQKLAVNGLGGAIGKDSNR
jgi:hypothetical protein